MAELFVGRDTETKHFAVYGQLTGQPEFSLGGDYQSLEEAEAHAKRIVALFREMARQAQPQRALILR